MARFRMVAPLLALAFAFGVAAGEAEKPADGKAGASAAGGGVRPLLFESEEANAALAKFETAFNQTIEVWRKKLAEAKAAALAKKDEEDATRIEEALSGGAVEFQSIAARGASRDCEESLRRGGKVFLDELKAASRKREVAGDPEEVERINRTAAAFESILACQSSGTKTVKVSAAKDWQPTGLSAARGAKVRLRCTGEWGSGAMKWMATRVWKPVIGDAETFNVQARVGTKTAGQGGKDWQFGAPGDGLIELRMAPASRNPGGRNRWAEPQGEMTVKLELSDPYLLQRMQTVVRRLLDGKPAEEPKERPPRRQGGEGQGKQNEPGGAREPGETR